MSVGSALTATSQTATQFVLFQFMTRAFLVTSAIVAVVIITEEFPAEYRGWGIGMLAGVSSIGFGLGAALYGAVKVLPFGWRALYLVGLVPVALFFWLRRGVVETRRFERARGESLAREGVGAALAGALQPLARSRASTRGARSRSALVGDLLERGHRRLVPVRLAVPADRARLVAGASSD